MVHTHINTYRHTNNSLTRKSFIYILYLYLYILYLYIYLSLFHLLISLSCLSHSVFNPFYDLLEEVDMWSYPVLYLKKTYYIYIYVHTNAVFAYIKKYKSADMCMYIIIIIYIYIYIHTYMVRTPNNPCVLETSRLV